MQRELNRITIDDQTATIHIHSPKHGDFEAIIDVEDVPEVEGHRWMIQKIKEAFYVKAMRKQKNIYLHRFLHEDLQRGQQIDHINHNPLDNRRQNLRICSTRQNNQNRREFRGGRLCKFKGVYPVYGGGKMLENKYQAQIYLNGKFHYIGIFNTEIEAAIAYDEVARKEHGEFYCNPNSKLIDEAKTCQEIKY